MQKSTITSIAVLCRQRRCHLGCLRLGDRHQRAFVLLMVPDQLVVGAGRERPLGQDDQSATAAATSSPDSRSPACPTEIRSDSAASTSSHSRPACRDWPEGHRPCAAAPAGGRRAHGPGGRSPGWSAAEMSLGMMPPCSGFWGGDSGFGEGVNRQWVNRLGALGQAAARPYSVPRPAFAAPIRGGAVFAGCHAGPSRSGR